MKRITALFLLIIMAVLSLSSCKDTDVTPNNTVDSVIPTLSTEVTDTISTETPLPDAKNKIFVASNSTYIYNNMYFYTKAWINDINSPYVTGIKYQYLDDITDTGHNIFDASIGQTDIFTQYNIQSIKSLAVDREATNQNNGVPVLIICCKIKGNENHSFLSYNMANNKLTVILDNTEISSSMSRFYIYGDLIYYLVYAKNENGSNATKVRSIKKDGTDLREYDISFDIANPSFTFYNDKIYYTKDVTIDQHLYVADINFENSRVFTEIKNIANPPKIKNGYIYYLDNTRNVVIDGISSTVYDLYRRSLDDYENSSPEILIPGIRNYYLAGSKVIYYTKDDVVKIEGMNFDYVEPHILRCYDTQTDTHTKLIVENKEKESMVNIFRVSDDFLIYEKGPYQPDAPRVFFSVDLNTGEVYSFPSKL